MYGIRILAFLTTEVYIHHNWYDVNKLTNRYGRVCEWVQFNVQPDKI